MPLPARVQAQAVTVRRAGVWAVGLFAGVALGGLFSIGLLLAGRGGRKTKVPYGPFMLLGVLLAVLVGRELGEGYLSLFGV